MISYSARCAFLIPFALPFGCAANATDGDGLESGDAATQGDAAAFVQELEAAAEVFARASIAAPDPAAVERAREAVRASPTAPRLVREINRIMRASRAGHQAVATADDCTAPTHEYPKEHHSRFGVCGRPSGDGVVITFARAGNALGLLPGDWVRAVDGARGAELFESSVAELACGSSVLNESAMRATGAASLFGTVRPRARLDVVAPDGEARTIIVPESADSAWTSCTDPWVVASEVENIEGRTRPDGVAVLVIRRFRETPAVDERRFAAIARDIITRAAGAPLVIDGRGNRGGLSVLLEDVLRLLPGARSNVVATCTVPDGFRFVISEPAPVAPSPSRVVVLVDGLAFSAGDFLPLMAQRGVGIPIVGLPTQGELNAGATTEPVTLTGPVPIKVMPSRSACVDSTGAPLIGAGAAIDHVVELTPEDVAAGIDSQLEVAARVARTGR